MKNKLLIKITVIIVLIFGMINAAGTEAGSPIFSPSTNIDIAYNNGSSGTVTSNGSMFSGLTDISAAVDEINGLVFAGTNINSISAATIYAGGVYTELEAGAYQTAFSFLNRGNTSENIQVAATVYGQARPADNAWTLNIDSQKKILEDQIGVFYVTLNVLSPVVLDEVLYMVTGSLVNATNVVSYNAFDGAVRLFDSGFTTGGSYGGVDNIVSSYRLAAEGFNLAFTDKSRTLVDGSPLIPGKRIKYTTKVKNNSSSIATGVKLLDTIPNQCHIYYNDTPTITNVNTGGWQDSVGNKQTYNNSRGAGSEVGWDNIEIIPGNELTAEYTVTVD